MLRFLQKLAYCGAVAVGLMAAKADDAVIAPAATQVTCGGVTWTHDEFLGNFNGQAVYTIIQDNRIYIRWNGNSDPSRINKAFDNIAILVHLDTNRFPNNTAGNAIVNGCVNTIDPTTMGNNYLQPAVDGGIPCNNKVIGNDVLLGTYIGGDGVKTYNYALIVDGLLRVNFHREGNDRNYSQLSMGLINGILNKENGSYLNPNLGFTLNQLEFQSCFWADPPKVATPVGANNCASGPTVGSVSNITTTGLRFAFTGSGISTIKWRIKSAGTEVRSATTGTISSSPVDITYASLASGTYTLEIEGGNCTSSVSSTSFTIPGNGCAAGPTVGAVSSVTPTGLRFAYTGTGVTTIKWRIKSNGSEVRSATTGTLSGTNVDITYAALTNGNYTLEIEGGNCSSTVSSTTFTVTGGGCGRGPALGTISNVSQTGLRFQFDGDGVNTINWRVKSAGNTVRSGNTGQLSSAIVNLTYTSLAAGSYTLEIEGGSCTSVVSSAAFTIVSGPCTGGPTISSITNITASSASVTFAGTNISSLIWRIKSGSNVVANGTAATSSNTAALSFNSLSNGSYTLEIEGGSCTSSVSSQAFTIAVTDTRPACSVGPNLVGIYNPTSKGLTFNFYGENVPSIDWKVKSGANVLRQNRVSLVNDRPAITFDELPDGEYNLEIQGGACKSTTSTMAFTVIGSALPIYISGLKGVALENGIELSWNVVEEKDGAGFEVIRYDGNAKTPQVIKKVPLSDSRLGKYSVLDESPALGLNYYQLKMIDKDGTSEKSSIVAVRYDQILASLVAPNPARDFVNIEFTSRTTGKCTIETYNIAGRKMQSVNSAVKSGRNKINLNTSGFADGHYFVKVLVDGEEVNLRFVKSK